MNALVQRWRRGAWLLFILGVLPAVAVADTQKGSSMLALFGGLGYSSSEYDLGANGGSEPVAKGGGTWGAQWVYFLRDHPLIGVGLDVASTRLADRHTLDLLPGKDATTHMNSTVTMLLAKLAYPTGMFRPYVFGGLGVHHSSYFVSAKPYAPFFWSDTSTTESRVLLDDSSTSLALGGGVGFDAFINEKFFLGAEYRGMLLGHDEFEETAAARSQGLDFEGGSLNVQGFLFRVGFKFGP